MGDAEDGDVIKRCEGHDPIDGVEQFRAEGLHGVEEMFAPTRP